MAIMNALRAHHRGGAEVLVYEQAPVPDAGPLEVLVRVHAASITFDELTWDATWTRGGKDRTPIVPSHEISGVVAAHGADVSEFAVGDGVYGLIPFDRDGAAADYATVPASCLASKPTTADHLHTSALPLAGLTAWQALARHAHLQPGERVLVQGATGGVGGFVTQIAAHLGGDVTASVRGSRSLDIARGYGAHNVLDVTTEDVSLYGPFDVVVDTVGGASLEASFASAPSRRTARHPHRAAPTRRGRALRHHDVVLRRRTRRRPTPPPGSTRRRRTVDGHDRTDISPQRWPRRLRQRQPTSPTARKDRARRQQ